MAEWMEELRRLDELRADSLITDEEYDKQKALLIPSENSNEKSYNLLGLGKAVSILSALSAVAGLITLIAFALLGGRVREGDSIDDAVSGDVLIALSGGLGVIAGIVIAVAFNQMSKRHAD